MSVLAVRQRKRNDTIRYSVRNIDLVHDLLRYCMDDIRRKK
jgi:hypothetical protein